MGFIDDIMSEVSSFFDEPKKKSGGVKVDGINRRKTTPQYRSGDDPKIRTGILASAPGSREEKAGRPLAGDSGDTVAKIIQALHKEDPKIYPSPRMDDYPQMNVTGNVHYKEKTGKTEASKSERDSFTSSKEFLNQIKNIDHFLTLGVNAKKGLKSSGFSGTTHSTSHPSKQNLNRNFKSDMATPSERHTDRIRLSAESILNPHKKYSKEDKAKLFKSLFPDD